METCTQLREPARICSDLDPPLETDPVGIAGAVCSEPLPSTILRKDRIRRRGSAQHTEHTAHDHNRYTAEQTRSNSAQFGSECRRAPGTCGSDPSGGSTTPKAPTCERCAMAIEKCRRLGQAKTTATCQIYHHLPSQLLQLMTRQKGEV